MEAPSATIDVPLPAYTAEVPAPLYAEDNTPKAVTNQPQPTYEEALLEQEPALLTLSSALALSGDDEFVTLYKDQQPWGLRLALPLSRKSFAVVGTFYWLGLTLFA